MINLSQIESAIHADCYSEFKNESEHALILAHTGDGLDFINSKIADGTLTHEKKKQLTDECFAFLMSKYSSKNKAATGAITNMIFWWIARKILWWLAQKLIQKALDAAVQR